MNATKEFVDKTENDEGVKTTHTIMAIAIDFDQVTSDPGKSRANEIRFLTVKNLKPSRKSKEQKPGGVGCVAGGVEGGFGESKTAETLEHAALREVADESGYRVVKQFGELFQEEKRQVRNIIHVHLVEVDSGYVGKVRETDEVDRNWDNWISLRQFFEMPYAAARDGTQINPDGVYFSHVRRFVKALNKLLIFDIEDLPKTALPWVEEHGSDLSSAINDLLDDGLIKFKSLREGDDPQFVLPERNR